MRILPVALIVTCFTISLESSVLAKGGRSSGSSYRSSSRSTYVKSYTRKDGTYVSGHVRNLGGSSHSSYSSGGGYSSSTSSVPYPFPTTPVASPVPQYRTEARSSYYKPAVAAAATVAAVSTASNSLLAIPAEAIQKPEPLLELPPNPAPPLDSIFGSAVNLKVEPTIIHPRRQKLIKAKTEPRTWTDPSGSRTIIAVYISLSYETVTLKRTDGKEVSLHISKLAEADQEWVWNIAAEEAEGYYRIWTDDIGTHSIEAALIDFSETEVTLELRNGFRVTVPILKLSEPDRTYLETVKLESIKSIDDY
jgi:hypothetical protein